MNKSARERIGRQNQKGSLGVIFSPRSYRANAHSKSANFEGRHSGGHLLGRPLLFTSDTLYSEAPILREVSQRDVKKCGFRMSNCREGHSMDQYRSRLKLSENFERHWSIRISGEIHMDQSLVHTFSWGNSYGPMDLKVLLKFPPALVLVHGWLFPELERSADKFGA